MYLLEVRLARKSIEAVKRSFYKKFMQSMMILGLL